MEKTEIFPAAEAWLKENLGDLTVDFRCPIQPIRFDPVSFCVSYRDRETGKEFFRNLAAHETALHELAKRIGKTIFVGGLTSVAELVDPCNWDVEVTDAYWQLVCHGNVIYG